MRSVPFLLAVLLSAAIAANAISAEVGEKKAKALDPVSEAQKFQNAIVEKDRAIDLAIAEIKKLRSECTAKEKVAVPMKPLMHPAVEANGVLSAAFAPMGWGDAEFKGIGVVQVKDYEDSVVVKVSASARPTASKLLAPKALGFFRCENDTWCYVMPTALLSQNVGKAPPAGGSKVAKTKR